MLYYTKQSTPTFFLLEHLPQKNQSIDCGPFLLFQRPTSISGSLYRISTATGGIYDRNVRHRVDDGSQEEQREAAAVYRD